MDPSVALERALGVVSATGGGPWALALGGLGALGWGFALWRRKRWIEDTPSARVRSMPMGRVELCGRAVPGEPLVAPLSGRPCAFYRFAIEELRGTGRERRWRTVAEGDTSECFFYLEDGTGRARIEPAGATLELAEDLRAEGAAADALEARARTAGLLPPRLLGYGRLRFREWRIEPGDTIYVLGVARPRREAALEQRRRVAERLAAIKRDPAARAAIDRDGDGRIDEAEWEAVRRAAAEEEAREGPRDPVAVGADPEKAVPFVIGDRPEEALVRALGWRAAAGIVGGGASALAGLAWGLVRLGGL